ncbi:secretogranin-1 [Eucyclogobius newberryi]|uniref:secretogranin-1 n=1 Tax=Eucyclogobius newberryi TaxID=166745 RepID=UPI003B59274B
MRLLLVLAVIASLLSESQALPVGKEGQREDVVTRCLVEVLSKALSKPDSKLDQECKDIIYAGVKHAPAADKKSADVGQGQAEVPGANGADATDIQSLLKAAGERRETPGDESWGPADAGGEREKRSWRPGRVHQRKHKRDEEAEEDFDRSQESWGLDKRGEDEGDEEEVEKRASWRPRYQQRKHKRDEEPLGLSEGDDERSQEAWDVDKRVWRPTHRYHHKKRLRSRRGDEEDEEDDGQRSQESWGLEDERDKRSWKTGRVHQRRQRRDEEVSEEAREEPDDERSQEYWDFDPREKRDWKAGRFHQRRHKRDEEFTEPDNYRSQEYWDFDIDKRDWRSGRHHQRRHKRGDDEDGERSQESWGLDKRDEEANRYGHKKRLNGRNRRPAHRSVMEKREPWMNGGCFHPASGKEKQLENLAAMDLELQKIAGKLHENAA